MKNNTFKQGIEIQAAELDPSKPINQQVNNFFDDYYKDWITTPIPGLDGMTPREASKTKVGREKLKKLFEYMKGLPSTVPFPYDSIKKELGLK